MPASASEPRPPMLCVRCHRPIAASRFDIVHYNAENKVRAHARLCSLACVAGWCIEYGLALGRRSFRTFMRVLPKKGPRGRDGG